MDSNIGEILCEAVDTIVSKRLEGLNYNVTQTCIIVNDSYKQIGRYTVKGDNNLTFEAYSTDTSFKKNDKVLVMIPNGNYNEQKIILNKISTDEDLTSSVAYISPLKKMLKFSSNIITNNAKILNDNTKKGSLSLLANSKNNIGYLNPEALDYKLMYTIDFSGYNNYSKLGISADFQTWLKSLGTVSGDYGLEFLFFDDNTSLTDREERAATYRFTFGINDILGNPYNFQTYFTQEKVIDITHLKNLKTLEIYFYQNGNFKTEEGEYVIKSVDGKNLPDNIFVRNLELYVGYDISEYNGDSITINTTDVLTFSRMREEVKNINLYWVRKIDDSDYQIIDGSALTSNNSAQTLTNDNFNINSLDVEVYWARQDANNSDLATMDILGANWIYKEEEITINDINKFICSLNIKNNEINQLGSRENIRIKAVIRVKDENGNWKLYESNILTFTTEDVLVDQTTVDALTGLSIQCKDGDYSGIYFIYDSNNKINDEGKGVGDIKQLVLYYNGKEIGANDATMDPDDIDIIRWSFWKNTKDDISQSMINFPDFPDPTEAGQMTPDNYSKTYLNYTIADTWYPSITQNTVTCTVIAKDGTEYKAAKELRFGRSSSQGSNYNLVIDYQNNKNAYELVTDAENKYNSLTPRVKLIARLYNSNGPIDSTNLEVKWDLLNNKDFENNNFFEISSTSKNECEITLQPNRDIRMNCAILQATCTVPEGATEIKSYKPIAIKTKIDDENARCSAISGNPIIIYNALGKPSYNSNTYYLSGLPTDAEGNGVSIIWNRYLGPASGEDSETDKEKGLPTLKTDDDKKAAALSAGAIFIKDNKYQVCICAEDEAGTIYWVQPIYVMQSNYDVAVDNNWDGSVDVGSSTIKASSVATGRISADGKFQGVILGEVDIDNDSTTEVGLFGIYDGIVTYSLSSKGQVIFQKDKAQILFGEDNQILCCDNTKIHNSHEECTNLLLMDFDERYFTFSSTGSDNHGIYISPFGTAAQPYLKLGYEENNLLTFNNDNFYLQSPNYSTTSGLKIDLKNGTINIGGSDNLFSMGKLKIDTDGEVYYNNQTLTAYVNSLIEEAMSGSE